MNNLLAEYICWLNVKIISEILVHMKCFVVVYIFKGKTETHDCITSVFCWKKTAYKEKKEIQTY